MAAFLRMLFALAIGAAAGALAVALQPQWALEINQLAAPILAKFQFNIPIHKPSPAPHIYANAVPIKDSSDGGFEHFLGPYLSIHLPPAPSQEFVWDHVPVTIVVDTKGNVVQATARGDQSQHFAQAVDIVRRWKFVPFERNGQPIVVRIENQSVDIHPPERRQDYSQPFPEIKDWKTVRMKLSRTECFGACPSYEVELTGEGRVSYQGTNFVALRGRHGATVDQGVVKDLVERFRRADFFTLNDAYRAPITDNPTYTVSLTVDGRTKTVEDYVGLAGGMPDAVHDLENAIDRAAGSDRWLLGNADTVPSLRAENWDFNSQAQENQLIAAGVAEYGSAAAMKDLIGAGAPLGAAGPAGYWTPQGTALEVAANRGKTEMLSALLTAPVKWPKPVLSNALQLAARRGAADAAFHLIGRGADCTYKDNAGHTILMSAAESGVADVIRAILNCETTGKPPSAKNTDVNAQDSDGATALILNATSFTSNEGTPGYDRAKAVATLAAAGASIDLRDKNRDTALTANNIYEDVASALLKAGANVNAQNKMGETALMRALTLKLVKVLLERGADPTLRNAKGQTAAEVLSQNGYNNDGLAFLKTWMTTHPTRSQASISHSQN
jgi:ankyrin repeat protein